MADVHAAAPLIDYVQALVEATRQDAAYVPWTVATRRARTACSPPRAPGRSSIAVTPSFPKTCKPSSAALPRIACAVRKAAGMRPETTSSHSLRRIPLP